MTEPDPTELIASEWRRALHDADGLAVWLHECLLATCGEIGEIAKTTTAHDREELAARVVMKAFAAAQVARQRLGLPPVVTGHSALEEGIVPVMAVHEKALRLYPELVEPQRAAWRRKKAEAGHGR